MSPNNLCIIQARMGSTRLPNKVLMKVNGVALLKYEIMRIKLAKRINKIVIATTVKKADDKIIDFCKKNKIRCFRGSENDVLDRYYQCALNYPQFNSIIRITGDCPLIDPRVIDEVVKFFEKNNYDYAGNVLKESFPDGMDIEIFKRRVLVEAAKKARLSSEREHVTLYVRNRKKFRKGNLDAGQDWSHFRLTVDEPADFEVIEFLIKNSDSRAGYLDYIALLTKNPEVMLKNMHILRNEGLIKSLKNDYYILK